MFKLKDGLESHTHNSIATEVLQYQTLNSNLYLPNNLPTITGSKLHACRVCSKVFSTHNNLKQHMIVHTEKSLKCQLCDKSFKRNNDLKNHINTHMGVKPFICQLCSKAFTSRCNLRQHKELHTDRQFKCKFCSKQFRFNYQLQKHITLCVWMTVKS